MKTNIHFLSCLAHLFLEQEMFETEVVGEIKTRISYSVTFFRELCLFQITWKISAEFGRPQMTIQRMLIAYWIPKATDTHSKYVIFIAFPSQQWLQERVSMLRLYLHCLSLLLFFSCLHYYILACHIILVLEHYALLATSSAEVMNEWICASTPPTHAFMACTAKFYISLYHYLYIPP